MKEIKPEGKFGGLPYNIRKPTFKKEKASLWNPDDKRFFTPKVYGYGLDINFYWFFHPMKYIKANREK